MQNSIVDLPLVELPHLHPSVLLNVFLLIEKEGLINDVVPYLCVNNSAR